MKDYKRLTERDEDGITFLNCTNCYIEDKCDATKETCCDELKDRLAELEDKIESGELCDRKEVAREIFAELYDDIPLGFNTITLSKDTIKDRAEAYGVILEDEE